MTDLKAKIAALPVWPKPSPGGLLNQQQLAWAALARLELLREWVAETDHTGDCPANLNGHDGYRDEPCTCGRDALLKATEVPR